MQVKGEDVPAGAPSVGANAVAEAGLNGEETASIAAPPTAVTAAIDSFFPSGMRLMNLSSL